MAVRAAVVQAVVTHSERAASLVADLVSSLLAASHGSWDLFMVYATCLRVRLLRGTARPGDSLDRLALEAATHMGTSEAVCAVLLDLSQGDADEATDVVAGLRSRRRSVAPKDIFGEVFGEFADVDMTTTNGPAPSGMSTSPLKSTRPPMQVGTSFSAPAPVCMQITRCFN